MLSLQLTRIATSLSWLISAIRRTTKALWRRRLVRVATKLGLIVMVPWITGAIALDVYGSRALDPGETYDAIIVPGCRVLPNGEASLSLQRRTRDAVELWRSKRAPVIILTGGVGQHPPSEARAAARVARELGVPWEALILEEQSTSTEENARLAARQVSVRRVVVVTDSFHVFRARRVFTRYFDEVSAVGSIPRLRPRVRGSLREVVAVVLYALAKRI